MTASQLDGHGPGEPGKSSESDPSTDPSIDPYDLLADEYRSFCRRRAAYFAAVDTYISERISPDATSLLDVGAGDGHRAVELAAKLGLSHVVLCEPSVAMAARCRELAPDAVWQCRAEELPGPGERGDDAFDVITCLWNVLGHVAGRAARVAALGRMRALLARSGAIYMDVNNRHNAAAYGRLRILYRRLVDAAFPDDSRGDAVFDWTIKSRVIRATGHLFTPREIEGIIAASGLAVRERTAIDYQTGARQRSPFRGQLVYILTRE